MAGNPKIYYVIGFNDLKPTLQAEIKKELRVFLASEIQEKVDDNVDREVAERSIVNAYILAHLKWKLIER